MRVFFHICPQDKTMMSVGPILLPTRGKLKDLISISIHRRVLIMDMSKSVCVPSSVLFKYVNIIKSIKCEGGSAYPSSLLFSVLTGIKLDFIFKAFKGLFVTPTTHISVYFSS